MLSLACVSKDLLLPILRLEMETPDKRGSFQAFLTLYANSFIRLSQGMTKIPHFFEQRLTPAILNKCVRIF